MANITVLGAGGWGLALSKLLFENGHNVTVWSAVEREVEELNKTRENKQSLPGVIMPEGIIITSDLDASLKDKDILVMAVASKFVRSTAARLKGKVKEGQIIVDVAKGIEEETLHTMTAVIMDELPNVNAAILSGPSHAEEVGKGLPTTVVAGARDEETAKYIQNVFASNVFRVYTSPDMLGVALGGSLKNVIALAAGIADGMGYGDNTKAALITRGIKEIASLGVAMGADPKTLNGLAGTGDLIVTCASMHSRNRRAGILIGQGKSMQEAMDEVHMVVEGVYSAKAALALSKKFNVEMPIVEKVNEVLFDNLNAKEAVNSLMLRDKKDEYALAWSK